MDVVVTVDQRSCLATKPTVCELDLVRNHVSVHCDQPLAHHRLLGAHCKLADDPISLCNLSSGPRWCSAVRPSDVSYLSWTYKLLEELGKRAESDRQDR
jgi:hypothetical protein